MKELAVLSQVGEDILNKSCIHVYEIVPIPGGLD